MKILIALTLLSLAAAPILQAQANPNPVSSSAREIYQRQAKYLIAAAELMPADKYTFRPTPAQMSYAQTIAHVADANTYVCGMLTASPGPRGPRTTDTLSKDQLITALNTSFQVCDKALAGLQDAQLSDTITFFGGKPALRAKALLEELGDLDDHYSQMAIYLRLNGLTPPSAKPSKQ
jgi:hypothetical protein